MQYVIITGNPVNGLKVIGPFETRDHATNWGEGLGEMQGDWWLAPLEPSEIHTRNYKYTLTGNS